MEPFIGQIKLFPYTFVPGNYLPCDGRLLAIQENAALHELSGTTYGGDGITNFALPDLRQCVAVGAGAGPGLLPLNLGQRVGAETVTLTPPQMASHDHSLGVQVTIQIPATTATGTAMTPSVNDMLATANDESLGSEMDVYSDGPGNTSLLRFANPVDGTTDAVGGGQTIDIRNPCQLLTYCIAVQGIYPKA